MDDWTPIALVFIVLIICLVIILSCHSLEWLSQLNHPKISLPIYIVIWTFIVLSITIASAWIQLRKVPNETFVQEINWLFSIGLLSFLGEVISLYFLHAYELTLIFLFFLLLCSSQLLAMSLDVGDETPAILSGVRVLWTGYLISLVAQLHDLNEN